VSKAASWSWRLAAAEVRDARHVHDGPEVVGGPAKPKDTKRWCKGKVGREHVLTVTIMSRYGLWAELVRHCSACGKEFDSCNTHWRSWRSHKPDWVTPDLLRQLQIADAKLKNTRKKSA